MDAFQHLNNVAYARYFETARVQYCIGTGWMQQSGGVTEFGPILRDLSIRYRRPVVFPATLDLYTHVGNVMTVRLHMYSTFCLGRDIVADAKCTVVSFDYRKGAPCPIPVQVLEHSRQLEATLPEWVREHANKTWNKA